MNNNRQIIIRLQNISRSFTSGGTVTRVLNNISMTISQGEMVAIMGASGSGKSSLMNIIGCLDSPSEGEMHIGDVDVGAASSDRLAQLRSQRIGFIFQRYHLMPWLSAIENVMVPALYTAMPGAIRLSRAKALLKRLGLAERINYKPAQLSGGQQQRVSIARALMNDAEIILADEPTGALDTVSGKELMELLHSLHQEGRTIVLVTHDVQKARQAERIIEISDGKIVAEHHNPEYPSRSFTDSLPVVKNTERAKSWRNIHEMVKGAWHALMGHRLRTFLSMLGIVIGISSVVSSIALGEGAQKNILRQINQMGTRTFEIHPGLGWDNPRPDFENALKLQDVERLSRLSVVDSISPVVSKSVVVARNGAKISLPLSGVSSNYFRVQGMHFSSGHRFSPLDVDKRTASIVINSEARSALFDANENPIDQIALVEGIPFKVIGVMAQQSSGWGQASPEAWIPYTSLTERLSGDQTIESILLRISNEPDLTQTRTSIEDMLVQMHGQKDFFIQSNDQITQSISDASDSMTFLIAAIAAISLLVGGVGVMNIMLVSVIERTHEIGIRLSVGARRQDIMQQFLIEAMLICLSGGLLGVALSLTIGLVSNLFGSSSTMIFSWTPLLLACSTSVIIGLCFGFFPARNAARLNPTQALARE